MSSSFFLTLVLIGASCVYLYAVVWSFRASSKRGFSTPWLLLPLSGAIIVGVTLVFSVPVSPAPPVSLRLLELLAHLCNTLLIWAVAGKIAPGYRLVGTWLYAWNPLVLIELAVYANSAGVVICLLLLAVAMLIGRGPLRSPSDLKNLDHPYRYPDEIAALVLVGLAVRINFMALLLAPLLLWFMVQHNRSISAALRGFTWRALVVLAIFMVAYLPVWHGISTFLAITDTIHLFDFANSPLSLIVAPVRSFFSFVAQRAHFPSLMQPAQAADMTVLATSLFLFALLYLREMGKIRLRRPRTLTIRTDSRDQQREESQPDEGMEREGVTSEESYLNEDKHKAPAPSLPRPLSLQDQKGDADKSGAYDVLFTGWTVVLLGYIVLAATVFSPGYIVWGVWVVALRRFDALSVCVLLLSCSALLYYPLQGFASIGILLPLCIFGIPLVYLIVQCCIPADGMERKNVLT